MINKILLYGIPITICVGMQYAGNLVDLGNTKARLLYAGFTDVQATEMYGYLTKFQQLSNVPISLVAALTAVILPAISGAVALKNRALINEKINYAFRLCFMMTIPAAVAFCILSAPIYDLLKFQPGSYLMQYGSVTIVLMAVMLLQTSILQGAGRIKTVTTNTVIGIIVKIVVNYLLISQPSFNIKGALVGSISGYAISILLNHIALGKYLKIRNYLVKPLIKPFAASAITGAAALLIYWLGSLLTADRGYLAEAMLTLLTFAVCGIIYFASLVMVGGISKNDLKVLPSPVARLLSPLFKTSEEE